MKQGEVFKWRKESSSPAVIHLYIADAFPKIFEEVDVAIKNFCDSEENEAKAKYHKGVRVAFKSSRKKLKNNGFQNGVISQAKYRFMRRGFADTLDKQSNLLGVGNGVLVFHQGKATLVRSYHDFAISKYTPINYRPYDANNPYIQAIERMAHQIYPENDMFEWIWLYFASSLNCKPKDLFYYAWGPGSCGKSTIPELIKTTLGNMYAKKVPISLFTDSKEKASEGNSALMSLDGCLFAYCSESKSTDHFNASRVKELISAEAQSSRELYGRQTEFYNKATLYMGSNHEMSVDDPSDDGFWRRFRAYYHKVKFVLNPDPLNPNEALLDESYMFDFVTQVDYHEAVLSILVHYKSILDTKYNGCINRVVCPTLAKDTERYRNDQDTINRFISEQMIFAESTETISMMDIIRQYKLWHVEIYSRQATMVKSDEIANLFKTSKLKNNAICVNSKILDMCFKNVTLRDFA
jgi:phage/plasmid-associated DNA primase